MREPSDRTPPLRRFAVLLAVLPMLLVAASSGAVVPGEVSYQGLLLDDSQVPIDGNVDLQFLLYTQDTGGTAQWSELHAGVPVVDGVYDVSLGSITPFPAGLIEGGALYLEIVVEGETLTPRQRLLAVPYAIRAGSADAVGGVEQLMIQQTFAGFPFDGQEPGNLHPDEGSGDVDGDGIPNFLDPDNDGDGLSDETELGLGTRINVTTPTIASVDPSTIEAWTGAPILVTGTNFTGPFDTLESVTVAGQSLLASNLAPASFDASIAATMPGTYPLVVTLAGGESASFDVDLVYFTPVISGYSTTTPSTVQTTPLTIFGEHFIPGTTVDVGAQLLVPTSIAPTALDVDVPAGSGVVDVTVHLPNGNSTTDVGALEFLNPKVIFVTSALSDGDLGGIAGADATCNTLAANAGLPGTFLAWLGDSTQSPASRDAKLGIPYRRVDGVKIADDWADLTDGTLDATVAKTETGSNGAIVLWSGVAANGSANGQHCGDWLDNAAPDVNPGLSNVTNGYWTWSPGTRACSTADLAFMCIEQ